MADPIFAVFAEILRIPEEKISDATSPDNTPEWDSLAAMFLIGGLEDRFEVEFSIADIMEMKTLANVRKVLTAKGVDLG
jgi:acyl carrier protein